jgi:hypothetical protein
MSSARSASLLLFLLFQSLYALTSSGNAFRIPDEFEVYFQVENLIDAGDLSVPQTLAIRQPVVVDGKVVGTQSVFFGKEGRDGKPYAPYGPLVAVLAVPHHLLGRAVAAVAGVPRVPRAQGLAWVILVGGITLLSSATAAALAVVGFYRAALALAAPPSTALLLSLMLGGATVLWPYSATMYSEAWQAAALVWAAALLLEARAGQAPRDRVIVSALLLTVAGLTKVTALVFAPAFVIAVWFDRSLTERARREVALALVMGIGLAVAIHIGWNDFRFGRPFEFGYDWAETIPVLPARAFAPTDVPRGLAVLLLSPGKSLFVWAPVLVLAVAGARRLWQREPAVALGMALVTGVGLLFYAAYLFPEGGYAHGPRNLVPILPLMLLPAVTLDAAPWRRPVLAACAALGMAMAVLALSVSYLEDEAMAAAANGYYERIVPADGRPSNRYRLGYIPFVSAMRSPGWATSPALGQGPDFFPLHLRQARAQLPDGRAIPTWLIWGWPLMWLLLTIGAASRLYTTTK